MVGETSTDGAFSFFTLSIFFSFLHFGNVKALDEREPEELLYTAIKVTAVACLFLEFQ